VRLYLIFGLNGNQKRNVFLLLFQGTHSKYFQVQTCVCGFYMFTFNSIQFILYSPISHITNLPQRALQSLHIRHPCPRTSHRITKNTQEIEKSLSPDGQKQYMSCVQKEALQSYINTFNEYDRYIHTHIHTCGGRKQTCIGSAARSNSVFPSLHCYALLLP